MNDEKIYMPKGKSITLLKSVYHLRVKMDHKNRFRSILVGIQFGVFHLPGELLTGAVIPALSDVFMIIYEFFYAIYTVMVACITAIMAGFAGHLEAAEDIEMKE